MKVKINRNNQNRYSSSLFFAFCGFTIVGLSLAMIHCSGEDKKVDDGNTDVTDNRDVTFDQCSDQRGGTLVGKSTQTVTAAGLSRSFELYVPPNLDTKMPVPLVIAPHYLSGSGEEMFQLTGYDKIADREGFVVAFPTGLATQEMTTWHVGDGVCPEMGASEFSLPTTKDDVDQLFIDEIIELIDEDRCVDRDHIFVIGMSMGGYFSHETLCRNKAIRAAGAHSAGTHDLSECIDRNRPVIMFHFTIDEGIRYDCALKARDAWVQHNGCRLDAPEVKNVEGGYCEYYAGCPVDGQVVLCTFDEHKEPTGEQFLGHGWSGGQEGHPFAIPPNESASELGWQFFKVYAW